VYLKHFGLNSKPFLVTPETESFYKGGSRKNLLESIEYVKITGEVGSGKTTICRYLLKTLPARFKSIYIADPTLSREQMLFAVADGLGVEFSRRNPEAMVVALQKKLGEYYEEGRKIVLMVDEAHAMPEETLDQIRLLSQLEAGGNRIMQVILLGPQELDHNLALPELRAVRDRIVHAFRIKRLTLADIAEYLSFKMANAGYEGPQVFSQNAVRLIGRLSNGLPRRINVSSSLDLRFEVRSRDIASAAREIKLERSITEGDTWLIRIGSFFMGATAGILCLMFALNQGWVSVKTPATAAASQEQIIDGAVPGDSGNTGTSRQGSITQIPGAKTSSDANGPSPSNIPVPAVDAQSILSGVLDGDDYNFGKKGDEKVGTKGVLAPAGGTAPAPAK
jgi:MSHA biogenesis protein MshM